MRLLPATLCALITAAGCSDGRPSLAAGTGSRDAGDAGDAAGGQDVRPDTGGQDAAAPDADDTGGAADAADAGAADVESPDARDAAPDVSPDASPPPDGGSPPEALCGSVFGLIGGAWTLTCDVVVPDGNVLHVEAGAEIRLGIHSLAVRGRLEAAGIRLVVDGPGSVTVQAGGVADWLDVEVLATGSAEGAPAVRVDGGRLNARGSRLVDGERRVTGLDARGEARLDLSDVRFEGFWVGLQVSDEVTGTVTGGVFSGNDTGVRSSGAARLALRDNELQGEGFHLVLAPGFFAAEAPGELAGNTYDPAGYALLLAGEAVGEAAVGPVDGLEEVLLLGVTVPAGATLRLLPGLELTPLAGGIVVAGTLEAEGVTFPALGEAAVRFEPGAAGLLRDLELIGGGVAGAHLLEVAGGTPRLEQVRFSDPSGSAVCLVVSGADATPVVDGADFAGCWVGVRASDGSRPVVAGSTFADHATGVLLDGATGAEIRDNTFSGEGVHLYLTPAHFAAGADPGPAPSGNDFGDQGTRLMVAGVLEEGSAVLRPVWADEPLVLGALQVGRGGELYAEEGLFVRGTGAPLVVEGHAELVDVGFAALEATVLEWREDASGRAEACTFTYTGGAPFAAVRITDASPAVTACTFEGGDSGGTGLVVAGTQESEVLAAPDVTGNTLRSLRVGVLVTGDAEPVLEGNVFEDVGEEVATP